MWIGVDPGGKQSFGIAVIHADGTSDGRCWSCADEAVAWIKDEPLGVGIDAPLWWSSGPSSDRKADQWLRRAYGRAAGGDLHPGTVQAANSLQGAALVQAAMFIVRLRERFPSMPVTESHPKALLKAMRLDERRFFDRFLPSASSSDEHIRDALIGAVSAREGFSGRWKRDLSVERNASEQDPKAYWLAPVHYFWPE
jgi:predicted nuclease with RNAse H fold